MQKKPKTTKHLCIADGANPCLLVWLQNYWCLWVSPSFQWPFRVQKTRQIWYILGTPGTVSCSLSSLLYPLCAEKQAGWVWKLLSLLFFSMQKGTSAPTLCPSSCLCLSGMASKVFRCLSVLDLPAVKQGQQWKVTSRPGRSPPTPPLHWTANDDGAWVAFSWWRPYSGLFHTYRHICQAALSSGRI